jgi:N-acetyltransferase
MTSAAWPPDIVLERDGIRLEPLSLAHEHAMREAAADGELYNIRITSVPAPGDERAYIEAALKARAGGERQPFAVIDIASGAFIGCTSYHDVVASIKRVEIGWTWYRKSAQRSHVNTTCKLMLMQHAFETLGCAVVGWRTSHLNFASQRAIERLGAKRDGVIRHQAPHRDGTVRDTVMYSMLASEWPAAKARLEKRLADTERSTTRQPLTLSEVTAENLLPVLRLSAGAIGERMVANNGISIAQAAYSRNAVTRVAYSGDEVVGFMMLYDPTLDPVLAASDDAVADAVDIWRLMIDFKHQRKGFGAQAVEQALRYAIGRPGIARVRVSYVPVEGNPLPFYREMGFAETGEKDGVEIVMEISADDIRKRLTADHAA